MISPDKIKSTSFFTNLEKVLKSKKVSFFQLRLKNEIGKNKISIGKKIKKICKKYRVKFLINDDPYLAKKLNADGCHLGQKDMDFLSSRNILSKKKIIHYLGDNRDVDIPLIKKCIKNFLNNKRLFQSLLKKTYKHYNTKYNSDLLRKRLNLIINKK